MTTDIEALAHARYAVRILDDSIAQWIAKGERLRVSLRVTGEQLDKLINKQSDDKT